MPPRRRTSPSATRTPRAPAPGTTSTTGLSCQRSTSAYPSLIAAARGYSLNFRACSGAKVADVTNTQLSALTASTNYVSISVGGNDAGFADVLTECATPWWAGDCDGAIDQAQAFINNTLPGRLSTLYASIRTKAPNAKVVVVGYPRIFMGEDCNAGTWFSPEEMTRLNQTADLLNSRTSGQASAKGFSFANPTSRFIGHAVCDDPEWINGLSNPISESYHPNKPGHSSGYTPTVSPLLTGAAVTVSGEDQGSLDRDGRRAGRAAAPVRRRGRRDPAGVVPGAHAALAPGRRRARGHRPRPLAARLTGRHRVMVEGSPWGLSDQARSSPACSWSAAHRL